MRKSYKVIDLFAGPGGLGEGFSSFRDAAGESRFRVSLSIEKDNIARRTLRTRKFFNAFDHAPAEYFDYLRGDVPVETLCELYPDEFQAAEDQAWQCELGRTPSRIVSKKIASQLGDDSVWILVGGPPCQAYSLVGRSRMKGTRTDFELDERHFLYREYLRIVARHQPPVFLMENVKGLLSATHGGQSMFQRILDDLSKPTHAIRISDVPPVAYNLHPMTVANQGNSRKLGPKDIDPTDFVVRAEDFGIPQARHRLFILGVRSDISVRPERLAHKPRTSTQSVLADLPRMRSRLSKEPDSYKTWLDALDAVRNQTWYRSRTFIDVARIAKSALNALGHDAMDTGAPWLPYTQRPTSHPRWYRAHAHGLSNHETRGHMRGDLHRYLFASCFAQARKRSPTLKDFPAALLPQHENAGLAQAGKMFSDRFRVQVADEPSSTITSHISKDGHYFIHFDPTQCRSLSVREAARLQSFPDSYFFEGPRTAQYHQVGNAVPPLLARQIAEVVCDLLDQISHRKK